MKIIRRNKLRRGGFAGLRETRMVMSPRVFHTQRESGTSAGIGKLVYLADAGFLPLGDTRMHEHREIDVISIMVDGRIHHEGSLEHGQELLVGDIQVQRAGGDGFSHNEINPDASKNRMIQLWVLPETPGEPAAYQVFKAQANGRTRVYGGEPGQGETIAARTVIELVHLDAGDDVEQAGNCLVYVTTGEGTSDGKVLEEGSLVEDRNFNFTASADSKLILVYEV
jgi:redox-sensitive bicupin YhaK (pirin superfamily)